MQLSSLFAHIGSSQMSLLARVKRLELKVLAMKGHSGEYEHMYNTQGND